MVFIVLLFFSLYYINDTSVYACFKNFDTIPSSSEELQERL